VAFDGKRLHVTAAYDQTQAFNTWGLWLKNNPPTHSELCHLASKVMTVIIGEREMQRSRLSTILGPVVRHTAGESPTPGETKATTATNAQVYVDLSQLEGMIEKPSGPTARGAKK
jgi:hypothetical protein